MTSDKGRANDEYANYTTLSFLVTVPHENAEKDYMKSLYGREVMEDLPLLNCIELKTNATETLYGWVNLAGISN
jgi:hypothetical protein